jgi:hypothetical protein
MRFITIFLFALIISFGFISLNAYSYPSKKPLPGNTLHFNHSRLDKNFDEDGLFQLASITLAPHLNMKSRFNSGKLVVNNPSINEDAFLLTMRANYTRYFERFHTHPPRYPRLVFSGVMRGEGSYQRTYDGTKSSDINLSSAELDILVEGYEWVNGFFTIEYENDTGFHLATRRINNARFHLSKGFVMMGDLLRSPLYMTVGQMDVPFGRFSSSMISSPITKSLGRIKARALLLGYRELCENNFFGAIYAFKGDAAVGLMARDRVNTAGANIGYLFNVYGTSGEIGASYVTSITDSTGIQGSGLAGGNFTGLSQAGTDFATLNRRVPAYDIHTKISYGPVTFLGEYVKAINAFSLLDIGYQGRGALVSAGYAEIGYGFDIDSIHSMPASVALGFGFTKQALAFSLPASQWITSFNVYPLKNVSFSAEFRHSKGYAMSDAAVGPTRGGVIATIDDTLNGHDNAVTLQVSLYF